MPEILTRKGTIGVAPGAPSTFDQERRTVELIWSTGAAVERNGRRPDGSFGPWIEELDTANADLTRLNAGAPLLNAHASWDVRDVIGVVESARISGSHGVARVRFSERAEVEPIARDVASGILRNVSVGYQVLAWEVAGKPGDQVPRFRATSWQPLELSIVPIPADAGAQTRSQPRPEGLPMETQTAASAATAAAGAADPVLAERGRVQTITDLCERSGIGADVRNRYISEGRSIDFVRDVVLDVRARRDEAISIAAGSGIELRGGYDANEPRGRLDAMAEGILARRRPDLVRLERGSRGEIYRGMTDDDILREVTGDRRATLRSVVLGSALSRTHTTSDFPLLLENVGNKALQLAQQQAKPTYRQIAAQRSFHDFRVHGFYRAGDFPAPLLTNEAAEIQYGTLGEEKESATAVSYTRRLAISRQVLVNDGMGAFAEPATMAARRVLDLENSLVFAQLAQNAGSGPNLRDTTPMCTTARGNKASSGTAIDATNIGLARAAMLKQTSLDGLKLNITAKTLLVGPDKLHQAMQVVNAAVVPTKDSDANPWKNSLDVQADANISGNNWYLFADPSQVPTLIWGYLEDYDGARFETQESWDTDGIECRVILYFGTGAIDWRGAYHNPGA